ncbi:MAG TPA: hypothetical protein VFJ85_01895 [Acidimicrobiales bacterium]|nr:hypothetical protein [Acidimicrobiales bacterium]
MRPPRKAPRLGAAILVVAAAVFAGAVVGAPAADAQIPTPPLPGPCDLPVIGTVCAVPHALADAAVGAPAAVANGMAEAVARWVASGAASFVDEAGRAISAGTAPDLAGAAGRRAWYAERYRDMALVALGLFVPLLILAVLHGVLTSSPAILWRAVANLPVATLGTAGAVVVTQALLGATDAAAAFVGRGLGADSGNALSGVSATLTKVAVALPGPGLLGAVLLGLFCAFAAFVVWLELVVREAAVYLTVAFLPLGFATYIWPALSAWLRRLVEVVVALVLAKLVIVAALALATLALAAQEGLGALVAGAGMLLLAAFAPFTLFKLIPVASMAAVSALEGHGRRGVRAATPRLSTVYYARAVGGFRRSSRSRPPAPGGGGGGASATGGAAKAAGGAAGGPVGVATAVGATAASGARRAGGAAMRTGHTLPAAAADGGANGNGASNGNGRPGPAPKPGPPAAGPVRPARRRDDGGGER